MTTPTQPPQPYGQHEPPRKQSKGPALTLGVVVGLLVGGGGVGLAWTLSSPSFEGAEADAHAACEVVERTSDIVVVDESSNVELLRWGGAVSLALAASDTDEAYTSLYEAVAKPYQVFQKKFTTDDPEFTEAMEAARAACAEL